jgi:hypothetical protein
MLTSQRTSSRSSRLKDIILSTSTSSGATTLLHQDSTTLPPLVRISRECSTMLSKPVFMVSEAIRPAGSQMLTSRQSLQDLDHTAMPKPMLGKSPLFISQLGFESLQLDNTNVL